MSEYHPPFSTYGLANEGDLLPCPFCGEDEHLYRSFKFGAVLPYGIDCVGCGSEFIPREGSDPVALWNRRAPSPAKQAEEQTR